MPSVNVFIPCLVDQVCPQVGVSLVRVLQYLGYDVRYRSEVTCCGQPAFNSGQLPEARRVAGTALEHLALDDEPIVCPSGSCSAMLGKFLPRLFAGEPQEAVALGISRRVVEFSRFLVQEKRVERLKGRFSDPAGISKVAFHNSCHSYRELRLLDEPLALLRSIEGIALLDVGEPVCCGFGGLFSLKLPNVAGAMSKTCLERFTELGVKTLVSNDPGCILQLQKERDASGLDVEILHLVEFLARALNLDPETLGDGKTLGDEKGTGHAG